MDLNNPSLEESFVQRMARKQKEQRDSANPEIVAHTINEIKKTIEAFCDNPNNCFVHEITFGIRATKTGTMELFNQKEGTTVSFLSMSELMLLDRELDKQGFRTSGSYGDDGHIHVRWDSGIND